MTVEMKDKQASKNSDEKHSRMLGVWLPERTIDAIKCAVNANSDYSMSEFTRKAIVHQLEERYPEIYERLRKGEPLQPIIVGKKK